VGFLQQKEKVYYFLRSYLSSQLQNFIEICSWILELLKDEISPPLISASERTSGL